jgi:hypothetical protein
MPTLKIQIPTETKYFKKELKEFFLAKLFEADETSSCTAVKILEIERRDFKLLLSKYNACYLDYELCDYEKKLISDIKQPP